MINRMAVFAAPSQVFSDHIYPTSFIKFKNERYYLPPDPKIEPIMVQAGQKVAESYRVCGSLFNSDIKWSSSLHDYYYLDKSGNYLLVLEREHRKNVDHITIYLKPSSEDQAKGGVKPFVCIPVKFSAKWWLPSQCKHYYAVAGNPYGKDGLELAVFKIDYHDSTLDLKKITKLDCSRGQFDKSDNELLAWAINDNVFVAFTLKMLREENTIQMYVFSIEEEKISCEWKLDLKERMILFGQITDICLRKDESVVFTTNTLQIFRFDLKAKQLSKALTLDALNFSQKRKNMYIGRVEWYTESDRFKEVYYACSATADLFQINVDEDNQLKKNSSWQLSKIDMLKPNLSVVGFSIDKHSSRGCLLFQSGDILCINMLDPLSSHKIILVNSDLRYAHPRFFINWRTSEVVVYNNERFCSQLIPYEEFSLKHIARMAVLEMFSEFETFELPKGLMKYLQFRVETHLR